MTGALTSALALLLATSPQLLAARPTAGAAKPTARPTAKPRATPTAKPRAKPTRRPTAGKAKPIKIKKLPKTKLRRAAVKPMENKDGSAAMAALLRQYVEGGGKKKFEKQVAKSMNRRGASKAAAARLLTRIEGANGRSRSKVLGQPTIPRSTRRAKLAAGHAAALYGGLQYLQPAISLPPEGISAPSTYSLKRTGLVTLSTEDADGTDELTTLVIIATPNGDDFDLQTVDLGSGESATTGATAGAGTLYSGPAKRAMFVTALIEDDNGNAAAASEEIEVLVGLAASVAATMPGNDRLAVLKTMVDYTIALDAVGADASRAARSVVASTVGQADWAGLWGGGVTNTGGIDWKLAVPHQMGTGSYELLLDIPASIPEMQTVRVRLSEYKTSAIPENYEIEKYRLSLSINGASHTFKTDKKLPPSSFSAVERKVIAGNVEIGVSGERELGIDYPASIDEFCANAKNKGSKTQKKICNIKKEQYRRLVDAEPTNQPIDFAGGSATNYKTTYSTSLGGFKPAVNPKGGNKPSATKPAAKPPIRSRRAKGTANPWGSVKITANNTAG